jgi:hypothetical protein
VTQERNCKKFCPHPFATSSRWRTYIVSGDDCQPGGTEQNSASQNPLNQTN